MKKLQGHSMKRRWLALGTAALCVSLLASCGKAASTDAGNGAGQTSAAKTKVVCATFPAYDWVREIAGERADGLDVRFLMGNGVDLHSYQPSVEDIASIASADLFVYVGGESDTWATDALKAAKDKQPHVVNMMDAVGDDAVEEEVVEGMQADDNHDHEHGEAEEAEHDHEHGEAEAEEVEYDEHVWLSLRNASKIVKSIADELAAADPEGASTYQANAEAYGKKLLELDGRYQKAVSGAKKDTVVFADRFPFRYLADDYDLTYFAAFVGCSAETEASFETVSFLAKKLDELELPAVFTIEGSDQKIAQTVVANTKDKNRQILTMDSMQSTSTKDAEAGKTYLATMEENLDALSKALA